MKRMSLPLSVLSVLFIFVLSFANESGRIVFNFESGSLVKEGWTIVEGANSKPIGSRDSIFHSKGPYPKQGRCYLTTLESVDGPKTYESNQCVLESPVFRLTGGNFHFMLGGGNIPQTWLSLCELKKNGDYVELRQFRGANKQTMDKITLDLSDYLGRPLFFRLVDHGKGAWSYLHADDFSGQGNIDEKGSRLRRDYLKSLDFQKQQKKALATVDSLIPRLNELIAEDNNDSEFSKKLNELKVLRAEMAKPFVASASYSDFDARWIGLLEKLAKIDLDLIYQDSPLRDSPILYVSRPAFPYEHHNTESTYQTDDILVPLDFPGIGIDRKSQNY